MMWTKAAFSVGIVAIGALVLWSFIDRTADVRVEQVEVERREAQIEVREEANEVRSRPVIRDRAVVLERLR